MAPSDRANPLLAAIERYYDELTAFVVGKVGCPVLAADIVQETYIRIATGQPMEPVANPRAFLYRVAGNLAIDRFRQDRARGQYVVAGPLPEDIAADVPSAETILIQKERLRLLLAAVDELPPRCRQVFVMRKIELKSQAEIAESLGISRSMVEKHIRRALLHCLERLGEVD